MRYPIANLGTAFTHRNNYALELFELAIAKSGSNYHIEKVTTKFGTGMRNVKLIRDNHHDVDWLHTNQSYEDTLTPIRIPLFKGLVGWRISFIREADQQVFNRIQTSNALKTLYAGQGFDWPDLKVLQANKLGTREGLDKYNLFSLLNNKRIDYFPRSINEIWAEQQDYDTNGLAIEKHLVLRYPTAAYFFVSPDKPTLAKDLERGLENAITDGSFDTLFYQYFGDLIEKAKLNTRKRLDLVNPFLPPETPLERQELWFSAGS